MPQSARAPQLAPTEFVLAFYDAVISRNGEDLASLVADGFAENVTVEFPGSLPYGGVVSGTERLARMFVGMTKAASPVGPLVRSVDKVISDGQHVVAQLSFDWHCPGGEPVVPSDALELWTFAEGKVVQLRPYYWDTAAYAPPPA